MPSENKPTSPEDAGLIEDPVYRHTRREAKIILSLWAVALVYTCTYCYLFGYSSHPSDPAATGTPISEWIGPLEAYDRTAESLRTPLGLGIPDWVFYGIVLPWITCIVVSILYCMFIFEDDDLGEEQASVIAAPQTSAEGGSRDG